jgi:hypothetical protein
MAKNKTYLSGLLDYAFIYIDECELKRKEQLSNKGEIVEIAERKNPTIDYFLTIWLPKNCKKNKTIHRSTYYRWVKWDNTEKQKVVTQIDNLISSVQKDIAANEGKGIQYLKYKFGWTDKAENINTNIEVKANFGSTVIQPPQESKDNS